MGSFSNQLNAYDYLGVSFLLTNNTLTINTGIVKAKDSTFKPCIFPNPVTNEFILYYENKGNENYKSLILRNISGQVLYNNRINMVSGMNNISLEINQPAGIYFLEIWNNATLENSFKVVKR